MNRATPHAQNLPLGSESGIERLSDRLDTNALRTWIGNDDSQRNQHGVIPRWDSPLTLALGWRARTGAPIVPVGTFSLDLECLLSRGLIRHEDTERLRVRFIHDRSGSIYLQVRLRDPRVLVGRV